MKVCAFTVTRADTKERVDLLMSTIVNARLTAGCDFWWGIVAPSNALCAAPLEALHTAGKVDMLFMTETNVGQHVAWNTVYAYVQEFHPDCDYFLRLDDDIEFKSKRWLKRLVNTSIDVDDKLVISPRIRGLVNPPQTSEDTFVKGHRFGFLGENIGGIVRLHPMKLLEGYVSDVRLPMGAGDATGMGMWCIDKKIAMAYELDICVKHAKGTQAQMEADPGHFEDHNLFQVLPYVPNRV